MSFSFSILKYAIKAAVAGFMYIILYRGLVKWYDRSLQNF